MHQDVELRQDPREGGQRIRGVSRWIYSSCILLSRLFFLLFLFSSLLSFISVLNCIGQIFVDDVLVFRGSLLRSPTAHEIRSKSHMEDHTYARFDENQLPWGDADQLDLSQSIIFSNNEVIVDREVSLTVLDKSTHHLLAPSSFSR